ncbi:hypothetical protein BCR39DRAFT_526129 [Naematelia encephala]|uniref:Mog1p/PsbP-like protein n=1 Tax=Naematelia encephala TaxID=71784 RepID=A0A1Y2BA18_9TREE|nr:hypothetical protein BCR39DRAFT_526129 [Naematelia encephala]
MTIPIVQLGDHQLFGGAITLPLPTTYLDASDLRQVPDNQEVFLASDSETSLIVEVLAMVTDGLAGHDLWEAVKYHFSSLAHDNSALSSHILTSSPSSPIPSSSQQTTTPITPTPVILTGIQKIHKYSHAASGAPRPGHESDIPDDVWIGVALWRVWVGHKTADVVCSVNVNLSATDGKGNEEKQSVEAWWVRAVEGFRIVDFGLFGDS